MSSILQKIAIHSLITLCLTCQLNGQDNQSVFKQTQTHIMPFSLIDNTPRLRLGVEYFPLKSGLGYLLDIGAGSTESGSATLRNGHWSENYFLFEVRPEVRYYIDWVLPRVAVYGATELFLISLQCRMTNDHYYPANSVETICYSSANLSRVKYGFHLKGGMKFIPSKKVTVDVYWGFGQATRSITYSDVKKSQGQGPKKQYDLFGYYTYRSEGEESFPHIALGARFGYILNK